LEGPVFASLFFFRHHPQGRGWTRFPARPREQPA
jgi:hypothetical protein